MAIIKPRVVIAMSGGVDSSLAAALLTERGYECIGVTMHLYENADKFHANDRGCCSLATVEDARLVANRFGIPYYVLNLKDVFKRTVIDNFVAEYERGRTPNPCIACNKYLKFEALMRKTRELGADYLATGHYARVARNAQSGRYELLKGLDTAKDQSYALYNMTQQVLSAFLLPIGEYHKSEVRTMAEQYNLEVAHKPDSQEICFIPDNDYRRFLREEAHITPRTGWFVDADGRKIARHAGIQYYTIGQRKGLNLALGKPAFVIDIRPDVNEVVIGYTDDVYATGCVVDSLNWIAYDTLNEEAKVQVKIRYSARPRDCRVTPQADGTVMVRFAQPERAVTPGQSAVFYDGDIVLGGGIIDKVIR